MLQRRATSLEGESAFEVLARARRLEAAGRDIIHLEIGQPDFPTPANIREAAIRALEAGHTGYGPSAGLPELREAIAEHAGALRAMPFSPEQVVVAPGAKPLLFYAINALAGQGDEVVVPDPGFPMYRSLVAHSGARPVSLPLTEQTGFAFDPEVFRSLVSNRTRLVILNSPQNPTGGVLRSEDLDVVAEEAIRRGFRVLSDEVYIHFSYDAPFESIATRDGMAERTIIVDGFSKSYSMTGWRVGFAIAPRDLAETFDLYNVNIASCTCTFNQHAAIEALRGPQDSVREMVSEFRRRRDLLVAGLNRLPGIRCARPGGAFYAFPRLLGTSLGSREIARRLLEEVGVAVLPGNSFGPGGEGYLRLSCASSQDNLRRALERLEEFFSRAREGARM